MAGIQVPQETRLILSLSVNILFENLSQDQRYLKTSKRVLPENESLSVAESPEISVQDVRSQTDLSDRLVQLPCFTDEKTGAPKTLSAALGGTRK